MKEITSVQNKLIKQVSSLKHAKERKKQQLFIAEGLRTIETFFRAKMLPEHLFCTEKTWQGIVSMASEKNITLVPEHVMEKISQSKTPSGILAVFPIPRPTAKLGTGTVLAQISDPGNMGTLIRTAAAMGNKTVVIVEGCDVWSHKVVQASAGTIAMVDIYQLNWDDLVEQKKDLSLCALTVTSGQSPDKLDLKNSLLVIGNEANGLPQEWIADCEQRLTLSMPGETESLNAAIAGSIALYLAKN